MFWIYVLATGAVMAAVGVGAGAFGAHALKDRLTAGDLGIFETAVRYWMYHALGVCVVAMVLARIENGFMKASALAMIVGSLVFSGSLIALVATGNRMLGAVTPFGGVLLIAGWLLLATGLLSH
ncbi:MAG: DUF423 domain-containing protein [Proteobacteria bacterium]|nr:DUF423 domain-containing protein [Pseudomonadota bacterium]